MAAGHREQIGAIVSFRIIPRAPFCWSEWQDLNLRPPRPARGREGLHLFDSELRSAAPHVLPTTVFWETLNL
jgi:hypothetical protein